MRQAIRSLPVAFGLLILGACGGSDSEVEEIETFAVKRGSLELRLTEAGTTQARDRVDIRSSVKAQIVEIRSEGADVKKGDWLVKLDPEPTLLQIKKLESSVIQLGAELKNAETDLEIQRGENASNVEKAELKLEFAREELERYAKGDHPINLREKQLRIDQAETRLLQARDKYAKIPELLEKEFVTRAEAEEKRLAMEAAEVEVETAKKELELYLEYTYPLTKRQKEADLTEAEREIGRVKARAGARLEGRTAVAGQKRLQYDRAVEQLAEAKEVLESLILYAPQDGIVIYGGRRNRWGGREVEIKVGSMAYPRQTLIELPDLSKMDVSIRVHQADINKLREGQRAWVARPKRGSRRYRARVSEIGSVAQSGNWRDQVKRFDVVVQIEEKVEGLRAGMTVEVEIELETIENVLQVPLQCVTPFGGGFHVFVRDGDEVKKRRVRLGPSSDQYVTVMDGLEEGEKVLLVEPGTVADEDDEEESRPERSGPDGGSKRPRGAGRRP